MHLILWIIFIWNTFLFRGFYMLYSIFSPVDFDKFWKSWNNYIRFYSYHYPLYFPIRLGKQEILLFCKIIPPFVSRKCCIMKEKWRKPRSIDVFTSLESEKWSLKPYIIINISWVVKFMHEEESYYRKWKLYMMYR